MKTMQFIRAPDENVYIAPLNLIEIVLSGLLEWWMPKKSYAVLNDYIMAVLYSPLLCIAAFVEMRNAYGLRSNRARGEEDDDVVQEWEQSWHLLDLDSEGWAKTCEMVRPNLDDDPALLEVRKLREEVDQLKAMIVQLLTKSDDAMSSAEEQQGEGAGKTRAMKPGHDSSSSE